MSRFSQWQCHVSFFRLDGAETRSTIKVLLISYFGVGVGVGVDQKPGVGVGAGVGTALPRLCTPAFVYDLQQGFGDGGEQ